MGLLRGVVDSVSAKLAFFPPSPPSYQVSQLCLHDRYSNLRYPVPMLQFLGHSVILHIFAGQSP